MEVLRILNILCLWELFIKMECIKMERPNTTSTISDQTLKPMSLIGLRLDYFFLAGKKIGNTHIINGRKIALIFFERFIVHFPRIRPVIRTDFHFLVLN